MANEIDKIEDEIIDEFFNREISKEDNLGFLCMLEKRNGYKEMLKWLKSNPDAKYEEILDKVCEIYDR